MSRIRRYGSVLLASSTQDDAPNWWRIYSDGWCEQGGLYFPTASLEYTSTIRLHIPFKDTTYSIGIVAYGPNSGSLGTCGKFYVSTTSGELKTNNQFCIASCISSPGNDAHFTQYDWISRGWLSTEAIESLMQGKTYDSITQSWI